MPPRIPSQEVSVIVALMNQVEGLRDDIKSQTEMLSRKLDDQSRETRGEFKELREDISEIKTRLASGSEQIRVLRRDVDAQNDKCETQCATPALERKETTSEAAAPPKKMAWWLPLLIGGALAWVGERGVKFIINGLADPPAVSSPSKP